MIDRVEKEIDMLARHLEIFRVILQNKPIGIVALTHETVYPHHKVRYSLRVLEEASLIEPSPNGAVTTGEMQTVTAEYSERLDTIRARLDQMKAVASEIDASRS